MKLTKEKIKEIQDLRNTTRINNWGEEVKTCYNKIAKTLGLSSNTVWRACNDNHCPTCGHRI